MFCFGHNGIYLANLFIIDIATSVLSILGEQIKTLRAEGKSFRTIAKELNCSKGTVSFHICPGLKEKTAQRGKRRRIKARDYIKALHGDACAVCGYSVCKSALEFDHLQPEKKSFTLADSGGNVANALKESEKCILLCCRCHRERHAGLLDIGAFLEPDL